MHLSKLYFNKLYNELYVPLVSYFCSYGHRFTPPFPVLVSSPLSLLCPLCDQLEVWAGWWSIPPSSLFQLTDLSFVVVSTSGGAISGPLFDLLFRLAVSCNKKYSALSQRLDKDIYVSLLKFGACIPLLHFLKVIKIFASYF